MTRHRVFVVPTRGDVGLREAVEHWQDRHGTVFAATPDLDGYVQHQPTWADQQRLGGRVCAEAWFADAAAERRAFGSDHYTGAVVEDEERFVDRTGAWTALVRHEEVLGEVAGPVHPADDQGWEVIAAGCDPAALPSQARGRMLHLDRPGPGGGAAALLVLAVADEAAGRSLLAQLPADVGFVARPNLVLPPTPPGTPDR